MSFLVGDEIGEQNDVKTSNRDQPLVKHLQIVVSSDLERFSFSLVNDGENIEIKNNDQLEDQVFLEVEHQDDMNDSLYLTNHLENRMLLMFGLDSVVHLAPSISEFFAIMNALFLKHEPDRS